MKSVATEPPCDAPIRAHLAEPILASDYPAASGRPSDEGARELRTAALAKLRTYPYYALVRGLPGIRKTEDFKKLSESYGRFSRSIDLRRLLLRKSSDELIAEIKVVPDFSRAATYARTAKALEPHTDASFKKAPFDLVLLYCVRSDGEGGDSIVIALDDVIARLDAETLATLRSPIFPFGELTAPVIGRENGHDTIRYYRTQIEMQLQKRDKMKLPEQGHSALRRLDDVLEDPAVQIRFRLQPGDLFLIHNRRALHGRTSFSPESDRLLLRSRVYCRDRI